MLVSYTPINLSQFSHICVLFCLHLEGGTIQQPSGVSWSFAKRTGFLSTWAGQLALLGRLFAQWQSSPSLNLLLLTNPPLLAYLRNKIKHLIEEPFEHRNTNSFKLSVCLFYLGKTDQDIRVQFNANHSSNSKLQSHP